VEYEHVSLFVDDWAEEHRDIDAQDEAGRLLGPAKLPKGVVGIAVEPDDSLPGRFVNVVGSSGRPRRAVVEDQQSPTAQLKQSAELLPRLFQVPNWVVTLEKRTV
jgi:hypothetical protein